MGRENNIMNSYLAEVDRFADFFNAVCFGGEKILNPEGLEAKSEKYDAAPAENPNHGARAEKTERIRDIKKLYRDGSMLRIFALENQSYVDYTAALRNMQYDAMEYAEQLKVLRAGHKEDGLRRGRPIEAEGRKQAKHTLNHNEYFSGILKSEKLYPVYTLWFYHGEEEWDGPRSLRDMIDFGDDADGMSMFFQDYGMNLICLNDIRDFDIFHTELKQLFKAMRYRRDRKGLRSMMKDNEEFRHLEADTVEAISVMLHIPEIWENRENYMSMNGEREEYDMCQAMREICEEERNIGFQDGISQEKERGIEILIRMCKRHNVTKEETIQNLKEGYGYDTDEEAMRKMDLYW